MSMLTAFKACRKKECGPARIGATNIDGLKRNKSELGIKTTIIFRKKYGVSKNISPSRNFTGEGKNKQTCAKHFLNPREVQTSPLVPQQFWSQNNGGSPSSSARSQ
jgi:hypothetical protein